MALPQRIGIERGLKSRAIRGAEVKQIRQNGTGVEIVYRDTASGRARTVTADFCVCTIPFPVLATIDAAFAGPVAAAIGAALSQTPGWLEGALQSAHATVAALAQQVADRSVTEAKPRAA